MSVSGWALIMIRGAVVPLEAVDRIEARRPSRRSGNASAGGPSDTGRPALAERAEVRPGADGGTGI